MVPGGIKMSKFASQSARTVLKNFAKKALPTNVPPLANEADKELDAGMMQPGVLEQSTLNTRHLS